MASATQLCFFPSLSLSSISARPTHTTTNLSSLFFTHQPRTCVRNVAAAAAGGDGIDLLGDFGARDPFPAEIESNFGEKVLGNVNTEHKILIPSAASLSLAQLECTPVSHLQAPMSEDEAKKLLFKVVGWKLVNEDGVFKLQCLWRLRDFTCAVELINRICKVIEPTGHFPHIHIEQNNQVRAELWTASIGGLSMNDFIVAAKIDEIKSSDLAPRKRAWA